MYMWKLQPVIAAEGSVLNIVKKARRAKLSAIWVKIAEGPNPYQNLTGAMEARFTELVDRCHNESVEVWGWQVPHCADIAAAREEADAAERIARNFALDGLIMDAEGGASFFQGGTAETEEYGRRMQAAADGLNIPLAISSNDIPQNILGWLPRFNKIASHATVNYPQVYYGSSPSVANRLDRAEDGNAHVTVPFAPVGAAWIGDGGGCSSASACAERAAQFIQLVKQRGYQEYAFWHWFGAPSAFWEVLNTTPA
jgi:hypothetical protein